MLSGGNASDFSRVSALVCDGSPMIRQAARLALNNLGIRQISEAGTIVASQHALADASFDAVVIQAEIDHTDTIPLLNQMRLGQLGRDPFAVAVLLLTAPSDAQVKRAVDSGADDILLIPLSPDKLRARLSALAVQRKPFAVTHDYIGPDRRGKPRPGVASAALFPVPNPVAARMANMSPERYAQASKQAMDAIAAERIKRLAAHAEWECKSIHGRLSIGETTPEVTVSSLYRLETVCGELAERIQSRLGHSTDTVIEILDRCKELRTTPEGLTLAQAQMLLDASRRISGVYAGR